MSEWIENDKKEWIENDKKKIFVALAVGDIETLTRFFEEERKRTEKIVDLICEDLIDLREHNNNLPTDSQCLRVNFEQNIIGSPSLFIPFFFSNNRRADVVALLLENGADVNAHTEYEETPLFMACQMNKVDNNEVIEVVKLLLGYGANVNARTQEGDTPLMSACFRNNTDVVALLLENRAEANAHTEHEKATPLFMAFQMNNNEVNNNEVDNNEVIEVVKLLLGYGVNVNARTQEGETPLMAACFRNNTDVVEVVELLIGYGANVNAHTENGYTPLTAACFRNNTDVLELLLEHGAKVNAQSEHGYNPFITACRTENIKIVELLLSYEAANVNARAEDGETPLMIACRIQSIELVKLLLRYEANVNAQTEDRQTPLMAACVRNNIEIVKLLLEKGADASYKNVHGESAYSIANQEIKKILEYWPTTQGIILLQELGLYHFPEAKFYKDLKRSIGNPDDYNGGKRKRKRKTNKKQKNKRRKTIRNIKN